MSNDVTAVLPRIGDPMYPEIPPSRDETVRIDALDLLAGLWRRALDGNVGLEPGEWPRLQRVLLATNDLWLEAQR